MYVGSDPSIIVYIGESGLGKSTFVNTLFYADLKDTLPKVPQDTKTVDITPVHFGKSSIDNIDVLRNDH